MSIVRSDRDRMDRMVPVLLVAAVVMGGCRTRPFDLIEPADLAPPPPDLAVPPDILPPDFTVPDLTLPFVCRDIWVVDQNGTFSGFNTGTRTFTDIGPLNCPSASSPQTMGVARDGTAWVLYSSAELFQVDVRFAKCAATGFDRSQITIDQFAQMGSAFSADQPGGSDETFFVQLVTRGELVTLDTQTLKIKRVAPLQRSAELTGTGNAELWGFFPDMPVSFIARIDKVTGALDRQINVPGVGSNGVNSFAFAFWGGSFWIFIAENGGATRVYRVDQQGGLPEMVVDTTPENRHVIGAGVSSCAPVGLDR